MITTDQIQTVRQTRRADPTLSWGLVPTMGALHEGHLSLVRCARAQNDRVAASIFVNPTQFAPTEDLATYPRDLAGDLAKLKAEGVDLVFTPTEAVMYPPGFQTTVTLSQVTKPLEGAARPTHFQGVATVVAKLFNIVQPTRAYFGQKDAQQTVVIRRLIHDLNFNVEMVVCPIVREADGLALSSRNAYLDENQRPAATVLHRALLAAKAAFEAGERDAEQVRRIMRQTIAAEPPARIEYVSAAEAAALVEVQQISGPTLLSMAVFFGKTRLIDNMLIND